MQHMYHISPVPSTAKGKAAPFLPAECLRAINIYLNVPETLQLALVPIMQHIAMDKTRSRV